MSNKENDIYIERLLERRRELLDIWNGSDLGLEQKIQEIEGELNDLGVKYE